MVDRARRIFSFCIVALAAGVSIDCAGILGINPTIVESGEGGSPGSTGTAFQAPSVGAKLPVIDKGCASSIRAIYTDQSLGLGPIAADERGIFFGGGISAEEGYVRALTSNGVVVVTDHDADPKGIVVDHDHLYISRMVTYNGIQGPADVVQCDRANLAAQVKLSFGATSPGSGELVLVENELYFGTFTFASGSIVKAAAPFTASTPLSTLVSGVASPYHLAVDGQWIYYDEAPDGYSPADGYTQSKIFKAPLAGGTPTSIAEGTIVQQMAIVNGRLFWSTGNHDSVNVYDGTTESDFVLNLPGAGAFAVDSANNQMYVAVDNQSGGEDIVRIPLDFPNGTPQPCVSDVTGIYSIYLFGGDLFFGASNHDTDEVLYDLSVN